MPVFKCFIFIIVKNEFSDNTFRKKDNYKEVTYHCKLLIMKQIKTYQSILLEIISALFILLFVSAAISKLMEGPAFYNNLVNSPFSWVSQIAKITSYAIPILELGTAILLVFHKTRLKGLYAAFILMVIFTGYVAGIKFISPYEPCSCGGVITLLSWNQHFILNLIWIALTIVGIILIENTIKVPNKAP